MKKIIYLPILLLGLSLASCGSSGSKKGDFKDRSYEDLLKDAEKMEIFTKARQELQQVSSYVKKSESKTDQDHNKVETTGEEKAVFYSEGGTHSEEKVSEKHSEEGISYSHKEENVKDAFYEKTTVESVDHFFVMSYSLENGDESASGNEITKAVYDALPKSGTKNALEAELSIAAFSAAMEGYKVKGGSYEFVTSSIYENHVGEDWGVGVKEKITITKSQKVLTVSKEGKITKFVDTTETQTNRDPGTQAWYSSVKTTQVDNTTYEFKYDAKQSGASRAAELKGKMVGAVASPSLAVQLYTVSGETATPYGSSSVSLSYSIRTGINSYKLGYAFDSDDMGGADAVSFKVGASVLEAVPAESKAESKNFAPTVSATGWSNKTFTVSEASVPMIVAGESADDVAGMLEFVITGSASGLAVSDVVLTLY